MDDKRTPGLFQVETIKDEMICLRGKMNRCADHYKDIVLYSCKGIQNDGNNVNYQNFKMYYLMNIMML
jgi:hypothetical protein